MIKKQNEKKSNERQLKKISFLMQFKGDIKKIHHEIQ